MAECSQSLYLGRDWARKSVVRQIKGAQIGGIEQMRRDGHGEVVLREGESS